jgi:metal-sulfur cluster biosynthetic enzyme
VSQPLDGDHQTVVLRALDSAIDPCSAVNGTRLSLLELGMIDDVAMDEPGHVTVLLLLDDPVCLYASVICQEVTRVLLAVDGVDSVDVSIRSDAIWTEDRMSESAQAKMTDWRTRRRAQLLSMPKPSSRVPATAALTPPAEHPVSDT